MIRLSRDRTAPRRLRRRSAEERRVRAENAANGAAPDSHMPQARQFYNLLH
jgi:hypothetical protein